MPAKVRRVETAADEPRVLEAPSHDEIAMRAYELYQRRGETPGQDLDDWLVAERELLLERSHELVTM
jgi:hypothetical protein